jgi:hypothetical protein
MPSLPFYPWEPDKGPLASQSIDTVMNLLPASAGWGLMPSLSEFTQALGSECKGGWWFRSDAGVFNTVAATQTALWKLNNADLSWSNISKLGSDTITNGTFAADANWTKGTGWTIAGGVGVATAVTTGTLTQAQTLTAGMDYIVTYTIAGYTNGQVRPVFTGGTQVDGTTRSAAGTYTETMTAVSGNTTFGFQVPTGAATLTIDNVTLKERTVYNGPDDGELWTASIFGGNFYATNINDPLQFINMNAMGNFADVPGSPPAAKYVSTIGDFLFLAYTRSGGTRFNRRWAHSKLNTPDNWVIDGGIGSADDQDIPDGDDIVALIPLEGASARVIQRRAKRGLMFTPGSTISFQQTDLDASRGAIAPHCVVPISSNNYFYLGDTGFVLNDDYKPIGDERVDKYFFADVDRDRISFVKAAADVARHIIWISYDSNLGIKKTIGYDWQLDRWFPCDYQVDCWVSAVSPGYVLDDLTGVLDDYPSPPIDSPFWQGGRAQFGGFQADGKLYLFGGEKAAAYIETNTAQAVEGFSTFITGAKMIGTVTDYTMQCGGTQMPQTALVWSQAQDVNPITGWAPIIKNAAWHRYRVNVAAGSGGQELHAAQPRITRTSTRA